MAEILGWDGGSVRVSQLGITIISNGVSNCLVAFIPIEQISQILQKLLFKQSYTSNNMTTSFYEIHTCGICKPVLLLGWLSHCLFFTRDK